MHVRNALPALPAFLSRPFAVHMYPHSLCNPRTVFSTPHAWVEGGLAMTFEEILDQAMAMLQRRGRVSYRTLKLQFHLDEEALEALKEELIEVHRLAVDQEGRMLVWAGGVSPTLVPPSSHPPQQAIPHVDYAPEVTSP